MQLTRNHQRHNPAFTLIELLVVVAIIAILASLLLPALTRARAKAQEIACLNQMKQVSTALNMYANDFSDFIQTSSAWNYAGNAKTVSWAHYLMTIPPQGGEPSVTSYDYLAATDRDILNCPISDIDPTSSNYVRAYTTYGMYTMKNNSGPESTEIRITTAAPVGSQTFYKYSAVQSPTEFVILADSSHKNTVGTDNYAFYGMSDTNGSFVHLRHGSRSNIYFVDGHVSSLGMYDLGTVANHHKTVSASPGIFMMLSKDGDLLKLR